MSSPASVPERRIEEFDPQREVTLLGVRFDRLTKQEALDRMERAFGRGEARKVYIVNAHTLNLAWSEPEFRSVLNQADLLLNDGSGVQIAGRLAGRPFADNLVGTDLTPLLCERAAASQVSVFLLGGGPGVAERAGESLKRSVPGLKMAGTHHGYFTAGEEQAVLDGINDSGAGILLVAFGNPLQEAWIHRNADRLRCDLCVGIGGLVDHLGGRLRRAPRWVRRAGIEWVQILLQQPHKWRRYLIGNPLFLWRAVRSRLGLGP